MIVRLESADEFPLLKGDVLFLGDQDIALPVARFRQERTDLSVVVFVESHHAGARHDEPPSSTLGVVTRLMVPIFVKARSG